MKTGYFPALDGLRALACLGVLSHHCYFFGGHYSWPSLGAVSLPRILSYGYLGVELFFVLSGFLLTYPFFMRAEAPDWKRYAVNRARRIFPAYWVALIVLGTIAVLFRGNPEVRAVVHATPKELLMAIPLLTVAYNTSFWTLCVELRFYLALPALVLLTRRFGTTALFGVTSLLSLTYLAVSPRLEGAFRLIGPLPLWLPVFAGGIWLARTVATKKAGPLGGALIRHAGVGLVLSLAAVLFWLPSDPGGDTPVPRVLCGGAAAFFACTLALFDERCTRLLSAEPLVAVGLFSYSLYLIHLPVVQVVYGLTNRFAWPEWAQFFFFQGLVLPGCVGLAWLFYQIAERPFLRQRAPGPSASATGLSATP